MEEINVKSLIEKLKTQLFEEKSETKMIEIKNIFIKKYLTPLYADLKILPNDLKKQKGIIINDFKNQINQVFDLAHKELLAELENQNHLVAYPFDISTSNLTKGALNPITIITNEIADFFKKLNFNMVTGDEITNCKYNFDNLNIDINHPARDLKDSFYINTTTLLRTHCTASTAKSIENHQGEDIRIMSYGNVYRNDDDDQTHSHQFNQVDIVWIKKGLSIKNLK